MSISTFDEERGLSLEGGVQSLDFGQGYFRKLNTVQLFVVLQQALPNFRVFKKKSGS